MRNPDHQAARRAVPKETTIALKSISSAVSVLRVPQWSKNLLIFLPVLITHAFDNQALINSALGFAAFCMAASATYIFNDLCDREADSVHHSKRYRAFADNQLEPATGYVMIALLLILSVVAAVQLPWEFALTLLIYVAGSVSYTLVFKRMLGFDVVVLACLYVLRVIAGDEAIGAQIEGIDSSGWILGFSCLFFLSLAIVKRCSELSLMEVDAGSTLPGRAYRAADYPVLLAFAAAAAMASIAILMRYIGSAAVAENFSRPQVLWLIIPILVYWLIRLILLANRGVIAEDPVVFTLRDSKSQICTLTAVLVTLAAW